MRIRILSGVHLGGGKHGFPGQVVDVPDEIGQKIVEVERGEEVDPGKVKLRDPDPEPTAVRNGDPKPESRDPK